MAFDDAKTNFFAAARYGLDARLRWFDGRPRGADQLILEELLPCAERGLRSRGIRGHDVDLYLGVVRERVESGRTGAQWMLDSLAAMEGRGRASERMRALAREMVAQQEIGRPVHEWPLARFESAPVEQDSFRTIGQIMTSDVFTVHPDDLVDLAASLMDWEHLRYVPVEDQDGRLVGLLTHRQLLRLTTRKGGEVEGSTAVGEIMIGEPITVTPWTTTLEAIGVMQRHQIGCLPVVDDGKLVGIVTEHDFMELSRRLLERWLREG